MALNKVLKVNNDSELLSFIINTTPELSSENEVPNVFNYLHEINYQKFYKTTTSDEQMAMAFNTEGELFDLIEKIVGSLYEGYKYDKYIADKYMLCRRIRRKRSNRHKRNIIRKVGN